MTHTVPTPFTPAMLYGDDAAPWRVATFGDQRAWWIYHAASRRRVRIGPVRSRGVNYFERAQAEAQRRNADARPGKA